MPVIVFVIVILTAASARAGGVIDFGDADEFTISQPTVQTQVGTFDTFLNEYLLDTGASGILVGSSASDELTGLGLQTVATYTDYGVAGPETTRVAAPYDFHYAGSDGVPLTLPNTRIQTSKGDFSFYSGIAGMPLMMNRTVGINLAAQADMNALQIGVSFGAGPPPTAGRQYSVPLNLVEFPQSGQTNPGDPLPVSAPLPFVPVQVSAGSHRLAGSFLLDTGAQQCILSSQAAFDLGLDTNGNGTFDDEATSFQTVAGVGGSVQIPVLAVDAVALRAAGGVDLSFGHVAVGIVDIDPSISGVLGMNMLNTGWEMYALNTFLGMDPGPPGVFDRVDLDFRNAAATMQGELRLTMNGERFATSGWAVAAGTTLTLGPQVPATVASLANNGLIDVGTATLTVAVGLSGLTLQNQIAAGFGDGSWNGTSGITSSAAAAMPYRAVGWVDNDDGSVTVGFAAEGDTNLDGLVDLGDLQNILASGKYGTGTGAVWSDGDFNLDGAVNLSDLQDVLASGLYGQGGYRSRSLSRLALADPSGAGLLAGAITPVPEPAPWMLGATAAAWLASRCRRRR
ncbi:MAG: aspartyl protease family protein [Planctomycetia bacterium]